MSLRFCFKMNFFVATRSYCMSEEEGDHVEVRGAQSSHALYFLLVCLYNYFGYI